MAENYRSIQVDPDFWKGPPPLDGLSPEARLLYLALLAHGGRGVYASVEAFSRLFAGDAETYLRFIKASGDLQRAGLIESRDTYTIVKRLPFAKRLRGL